MVLFTIALAVNWTGWIVPLLLIAVLALMKRLPVRNLPDAQPIAGAIVRVAPGK